MYQFFLKHIWTKLSLIAFFSLKYHICSFFSFSPLINFAYWILIKKWWQGFLIHDLFSCILMAQFYVFFSCTQPLECCHINIIHNPLLKRQSFLSIQLVITSNLINNCEVQKQWKIERMGNIIFGNFYGTPNKIKCFDTLKCLTNKKRSF